MTALAETVRSLNLKVAQLESAAAASPGDWARLDGAATSAALTARHDLQDAELLDVDCDELVTLLEQLRYIKFRVQFQLLEYPA